MFPHPPTEAEICAVLAPLLAACDARGRRFIIELVNVPNVPAAEATSPEAVDTIRAAFWETVQAIR
jgi:hypothetical protein